MSFDFFESQLNPEIARNTAKAFANIFYSSQNDDTFTLERHNLIVSHHNCTPNPQSIVRFDFQRLLKTWGTVPSGNHLAIDENICAIITKLLKVDESGVEEILADFERCAQKAGVPHKKPYDCYKKRRAWQKRKEFIAKWDCEKLGGFAVKTVARCNEANVQLFFDSNNEDNNALFVENGGKRFALNTHDRKKQILFGYSLFNLNKTDNYLKIILERCSKENSLLQFEKDFIYCLWNNFETLPLDLANDLVGKFAFLYEKPILKLCSSVIKTGHKNIDGDLQKIRQLPQLHDRIAAIFCDLYFLSGRNKKILDLYQNYFQ